MSFSNVGKAWTPSGFRVYLQSIPKPQWVKAITLHHTASPCLADRPKGLTVQHIANIRHGYIHSLGWTAGPHLFVDDSDTRCILGMTPFHERGIHAKSFNKDSIGIEVLGDYDTEDPRTGRGLRAWQNTANCVNALLDWLSLTENDIRFHRDDTKTNKSCPGKLVTLEWVKQLLG